MNHTTVLVLFSIPLVCIAIVGLNQIKDEMFKKKFEIERRKRATSEQKPEHSRRYNDPKTAGNQSNSTPESQK